MFYRRFCMLVLLAQLHYIVGTLRYLHVQPPVFEEEQYEIKNCLSIDLEFHERKSCRFYAVMLDAGSTGTRVHIFRFTHSLEKSAAPFKLEKEIYKEVKPGLSHFANDPKAAASSIVSLLETAKANVPAALWSDTPLALKATAGLRLLESQQAEAILNEVEELISSYPFLLNEESVTLMSGTDEGIFAWFTLNFLLNRIESTVDKPENLNLAVKQQFTAVSFDLGGGSTQIAFKPRYVETLDLAPEGYIKELRVFGAPLKLYTHSYLGNGLFAARLRILNMSRSSDIENPYEMQSSCIPSGYQFIWEYAGDQYIVRGTEQYSWDQCELEVRRFVRSCNIDRPKELYKRDLFVFSYFFDRAYQAGFTGEEGGDNSVSEYKTGATAACLRISAEVLDEVLEPWRCLDLTYLYLMLTEGYGLTDDKVVHLTKKIEGKETSWALGAAYHLLNTYHEPIEVNLNWSQVELANVIPQLYRQCLQMIKGFCAVLSGKFHESFTRLIDLVSLIH